MNLRSHFSSLKKQTLSIIILLVLQFILGMILNLFAVPPDDPGYATESIFIKVMFPLHGINGLLLLGLSISILFFSLKNGNVLYKKLAVYGLVSILVAAVGGVGVVIFKDNAAEISSLIMSLGFIASIVAFGKLYSVVK